MAIQQITPPLEASSPTDGNMRKRVCKACDRCRLKKSKCDGSNPCGRCKADNAICVFGERKKSHDKVYPKGYVEMLEQQQAQLVTGLQELYKRARNGQGWVGRPLKETNHGTPLTHDILERLGALKQDGHAMSDSFEEDLGTMQQRLIANGSGFMQREISSDGGSDAAASPIFDQVTQKAPLFTDPFALNQFPPTPPNQSPYPQAARISLPAKSQTFPRPELSDMNPALLQRPDLSGMNPALLHRQTWGPSPIGFDDNMDFINRYESPTSFNMSPQFSQGQLPASNMNPCLPMRDWVEEDEFQTYFNPTML